MNRATCDRQFFIYVLKDSGDVRYVGWTHCAKARMKAHIYRAKNPEKYSPSHKDRWIGKMLAEGRRPEMEIIESGSGNWAEREVFWIAHFRSIGCRLTNTTDGGEGMVGWVPSQETRRKISLAARNISNETRRKMSAAKNGWRPSAESVLRRSETQRGRKLPPRSEEHRRKLSEARKPYKHSEETLLKLSAAWTPERRAQKSAEQFGKKMPQAQREAIASAHKGKQKTPEHLRRIADALRGRSIPAEITARCEATKRANRMQKKIQEGQLVLDLAS